MKITDLQPILMPTSIIQIDKNLYRGNAIFSPIKAYRLKKRGITKVIDLRHENNIFVRMFKSLERLYCKKLKINYIQKPFYSDKYERIPDIDFFDSLNEQIKESNKTYIHCHFGKHRTGFAVAMYQKGMGIPDDVIIDTLMKNDWENAHRQSLLNSFLQKFFMHKD